MGRQLAPRRVSKGKEGLHGGPVGSGHVHAVQALRVDEVAQTRPRDRRALLDVDLLIQLVAHDDPHISWDRPDLLRDGAGPLARERVLHELSGDRCGVRVVHLGIVGGLGEPDGIDDFGLYGVPGAADELDVAAHLDLEILAADTECSFGFHESSIRPTGPTLTRVGVRPMFARPSAPGIGPESRSDFVNDAVN